MAKFDLDAEMMEDLMAADDKIQAMFETASKPKLRCFARETFHKDAVKKNHQHKDAQPKEVVNEK